MNTVTIRELREQTSKVATFDLPGLSSDVVIYEVLGSASRKFYALFAVDLFQKRVWEEVKLITVVELKAVVGGGFVEEGKHLIDMVSQFPQLADAKDQLKRKINHLIRDHLRVQHTDTPY